MSARPLERPVFSVGEQAYTWAEIIDAGRAWEDWERVEHLAAERLAATRDGDRREPTADELDAAGAEFRYARGLLAADDMEAWLDHCGLTVGEWLAYLRGALLRQRAPVRTDGVEPSADAVWLEAVCSGELALLAHKVAEHVAACTARHGAVGELSAERLSHLAGCFEGFCAEAVESGEVDRVVAEHELGWTRVDWQHLTHSVEDVAREVALCVREDARPLAAVALDADVAVHERSAYVDDVDPALALWLAGAQPGDVIGPLPVADQFWVVAVDERVPPSSIDPGVRERAERHLVERTLARETLARVHWHERL
jgi:hypothetical protein